ncbi:hypothetical protein [Vacuolonema iberomarrocanum]|uniref:hypothetical protein n=1 Tax=Vacuolonema iberomarrocanum TaxID=3454632 RepID=UPI0019F9F26C|nr:hypothetical protein [filamentous cyanobacterium LEGE 07170]
MPQKLSKPDLNKVSVEQARLESARMQDVVMLVDNLLRNEEATIGMIVDCLYDIGSVRLIHQKVEPPILQDVTKPIAQLSKPAVRAIALRWLKKNCPVLLANWLYSKVKFDKPKSAQPSKKLEEAAKREHDETSAAPVADNLLQSQAAIPPASPLSQTPYPPGAASPIEAVQESDDGTDPVIPAPSQAPMVPEATAVANGDLAVPATNRSELGIVPLSEYNRAIAQIKYRDNELRRLRAQVRIFMALVLGSAIAMGGLLLSYSPSTELSQPTITSQSRVEE